MSTHLRRHVFLALAAVCLAGLAGCAVAYEDPAAVDQAPIHEPPSFADIRIVEPSASGAGGEGGAPAAEPSPCDGAPEGTSCTIDECRGRCNGHGICLADCSDPNPWQP